MTKTTQATDESIERKRLIRFCILLAVVLVAVAVIFHLISGGTFATPSNLTVILNHALWPTFTAWAFCFLFASGYTDMSVGGVMVLGAISTCMFGNWFGYVGVI
ncbi:MAG: hypothetical protein HUJ65_07450, partial [Oscillospiraceae bacterium]|nr:hypothetical protein [Oscillospiraceae bacterium]